MAQQTMYPAMPNSPATELTAAITDTATTISVLDASKLPAAPNLATIGVDETAETVLYTGKSGNNLTGVTRGFSGTTAKAWAVGASVARYFTSYDADAMRGNIADLNSQLADVALNVKTFGAKGDGITDDTSAVQSALNYAIANKRTLRFPAGTYLCDTISYGVVAYASQISLLGEGKKSTIIKKKTSDGQPLLKISDPTATNFTSGLTIADITFKGVPGNTPDVVVAYDMVRSVVERCVFSDGIVGFRSNGGIANEFINCTFTGNQFGVALGKFTSQAGGGYPNLNSLINCQAVDNTTWGIWFNDGRVLNIDSCNIENNGTDGVGASGGVFVGAGVGSEGGSVNTMGVNITNSWFEANKGNASVQVSSGKNTLTNCYFVANSATYDVRIIGGKYHLSRLIGDLAKESNVYDSGSSPGNFIVDCSFANMTYDSNKTTVETKEGRKLTRGGEFPVVSGVTSPLIQQGVDNTAAGVVTITFPTPFSSVPVVFAQPVNNSAATIDQVEVYNVTATGFTARKKSLSAGTVGTANYSFYWTAIGSKQ